MANTAGDSDEDDDEARHRIRPVDMSKFMNSTSDLRPYLTNENPQTTQRRTASDNRTVSLNPRPTAAMTSRIGWPIISRNAQDHITQRSNTYRNQNVYDNGPQSVPNIPIFHGVTSPPASPYLRSQIFSADRIIPSIHSFQSATDENLISSEPSTVLSVLSSPASSVVQAQWQGSPYPPEPFTPMALIPQEQNSPYPAEPTRNNPTAIDANVAIDQSNSPMPDSVNELTIQLLEARNRQLSKDCARLVCRNRKLEHKNRSLSIDKAHLTEQNEHLTEQNEHLTEQNERLTEQNERLTERNEYLESLSDAFDIMARDTNGVGDMI